jgi:hypothetical protein
MIGDSYDVVVGRRAMAESVCPYEIKITDMPYRVLWWFALSSNATQISKRDFEPSLVSSCNELFIQSANNER